jgi:hypothetical protein
MPANVLIELTRGDDWSGLAFRWLDSEREPMPIESAKLQVRATVDAAEPLLELDESGGLDISEPGMVGIAITAEQSTDLENGVWDLEAVTTSDQKKTLGGGKILVTPDVTR